MTETSATFVAQACKILGWQGGTIHQVMAEIERLRRFEAQHQAAKLDAMLALPAGSLELPADSFPCVACGNDIAAPKRHPRRCDCLDCTQARVEAYREAAPLFGELVQDQPRLF